MFLDVYRFNFEWDILEWFNSIDSKFLDYFFYVIAQIGGSIGILILMTIVYWCINKEKGIKVAFISIVSINLNGVLKGLILALRPFQYPGKSYLDRFAGTSLDASATGTSFPSGHSQNSGTLYSSIIRYFKKNWVIICSILMLIIVPISRLYLGVHFPGDVIVGVGIGIITTIIFGTLIDKFYHKKVLLFIITTLCFIPFLFFKNMGKDFYKGMGILIGCLLGLILEEKYVNFEVAKNKKINILRYLVGICVMLFVYLGIHVINHLNFIEQYHWLLMTSNLVTHTFLAIIAIVVVPYLFKKIPFLKDR
ncbi:MAG: phosphatase PAP2 family protein [Erysipelotrichaceae bacterium]|nr:phosphatase PAP2 family protein [Erysipelotrichaceae bacterium]